jgi:hypothetical protein
MPNRRPATTTRRAALRSLVAAPALGLAMAVPAAQPARAYDPGSDERRSRYRETDHVKAFYRTNGYETLKK